MIAKYRPYLVRLGIVLGLSILFTFVFNEIVFRMQKEDSDRAPQMIRLVIPNGTAEKVAAGENAPEIPREMVFVIGDVLEVQNEDQVSHQLGPIWVPPGATGKLVMAKPDKVAYTCSFQTTKYMGIDVVQATTFMTRLTGLLLGAPTLAVLLFIYSLVAMPVDGKTSDRKSV